MTPPDRILSAFRHAALVFAVITCGAAPGCVATDGPVDSDGPAELRDAWQPTPTGLRIYPSIRFVMEEGKPLLECRIELLDAMGDPVKSSGHVKCELFASTGNNDGVLGERLYAWDIRMTELEDQIAFYDPTVRGYLFRLRLASINAANRPTTLRITFGPARGAVMTDEAEISPRSAADRDRN
ncbi:MAG: hypothetical protein AAGE65_04345 [Planctomycetota bacterium]